MHSSQKGQSCLSPLPWATHSCPFPCAGTSTHVVGWWAESRNKSGRKLTPSAPNIRHFCSGATNEIHKEFEICDLLWVKLSPLIVSPFGSHFCTKKWWCLLLITKRFSMPLTERVKDPSHRKMQHSSVDCLYMQIAANIILIWFYFLFYCFKLC